MVSQVGKFDFIVIGAGIVGAATAYELSKRYAKKRILVIDKEITSAYHQTGRNSGVIHAGVYYEPNSLKAQYCSQGLKDTIKFCQTHHLPYLQTGKLIVATNETEVERLEGLFQRCQSNQLSIERVSKNALQEKEPNVTGLEAILVKDTGITDYNRITQTLLNLLVEAGGQLVLGESVVGIDESSDGVQVKTKNNNFSCDFLINCAGIYADELASKMGLDFDFQLLPFRGEYFTLPKAKNNIVNHLIYPVPDPSMPFLGVHLTRMIDGSITVGPNAVLAMGKEAYLKHQFSLPDVAKIIGFKGFLPMAKRYFRSGLSELNNSLFKSVYLQRVQQYCPKVKIEDLAVYSSGIRAQAVNRQGELVHDFCFQHSDRSLHVGNAPSPAATSAMPIGRAIADKVAEKFN